MTSLDSLMPRLSKQLHPNLDEIHFQSLALEIFAMQFAQLEPYRRLCEQRERTPTTVTAWQDIPAVPVAAFKTLRLHVAPPREVFRSSGTTGGRRSVHYHPFPDLYRHVVDSTFPEYCLADLIDSNVHDEAGAHPPFLALVPPRQQVADSSLGFMVDHVMQRFGGADSAYAFGPGGVETGIADAWCRRRQEDGRPGLILATSFALAQWLDEMAEQEVRHSLPPDTTLFDTGGFKGRTRELSREELAAHIEDRLAIPAHRTVREYGMTELTSQFYTQSARDGITFVGPPWLRAQLLDPITFRPVDHGTPGLLSILDLANAGSVLHVLTQDLGVAHGEGFRLLGRASGAELRGCSLTVEELTSES